MIKVLKIIIKKVILIYVFIQTIQFFKEMNKEVDLNLIIPAILTQIDMPEIIIIIIILTILWIKVIYLKNIFLLKIK